MGISSKLVHGVGIKGVAPVRKSTLAYIRWQGMLGRVHDPVSLERYPSYNGVKICEDWYYFEKFKKWHDANYIDGYHMDKDILSIGEEEKIYSPERCIFIPKELNYLLTDSLAIRGRYPQGVSFSKNKMLFIASVSKYGVVSKKGSPSALEAYHHYVLEKEAHVKDVAMKYYGTGIIDERARDKLLSYRLPPFSVDGRDGDVDYTFTYLLYGREFKANNLYDIFNETELTSSTLRKLHKGGSMRGIKYIGANKMD